MTKIDARRDGTELTLSRMVIVRRVSGDKVALGISGAAKGVAGDMPSRDIFCYRRFDASFPREGRCSTVWMVKALMIGLEAGVELRRLSRGGHGAIYNSPRDEVRNDHPAAGKGTEERKKPTSS